MCAHTDTYYHYYYYVGRRVRIHCPNSRTNIIADEQAAWFRLCRQMITPTFHRFRIIIWDDDDDNNDNSNAKPNDHKPRVPTIHTGMHIFSYYVFWSVQCTLIYNCRPRLENYHVPLIRSAPVVRRHYIITIRTLLCVVCVYMYNNVYVVGAHTETVIRPPFSCIGFHTRAMYIPIP